MLVSRNRRPPTRIQSSPMHGFLLLARSTLVMVLALAAAVLVNVAGGNLADRTGFAGTGEPRLVWDLAWFFLGGALAA